MPATSRDLTPECMLTSSRSSGPGGQNVNKVNTRVELRFHVGNSALLTPEEKVTIQSRYQNRISKDGFIILYSQTERSQMANRKKVLERLHELIRKALIPVKKRRPTKPTKASQERRLETKKLHSLKKNLRKIEE
jgi:ribosome-associated protein